MAEIAQARLDKVDASTSSPTDNMAGLLVLDGLDTASMGNLPLLVQLALTHYQFEIIHPVIALQRAGYDTTATHIMITPTPTRHKAMGR